MLSLWRRWDVATKALVRPSRLWHGSFRVNLLGVVCDGTREAAAGMRIAWPVRPVLAGGFTRVIRVRAFLAELFEAATRLVTPAFGLPAPIVSRETTQQFGP